MCLCQYILFSAAFPSAKRLFSIIVPSNNETPQKINFYSHFTWTTKKNVEVCENNMKREENMQGDKGKEAKKGNAE